MRNLFSFLKEAAERAPQRTAYVHKEQRLSYAEICDKAEGVGSCIAASVPARSAVAVVMDARCPECVCALMGVLAAGCFYAPLDPALPEERLRLIMENFQPSVIIADCSSIEKAARAFPEALCISADEALEAPADSRLIRARRDAVMPDDLAMVLYTSGSTGIPKGVAHTQKGMTVWTETTVRKYGFTQDTVFANISPFYYANSLLELFVPMLLGAEVVMIPPSYLTFPKRLASYLQEEGVTELCMTPSSFVVVANSGALSAGALPKLGMFIMSGEVMPKPQLEVWMEAAPNAAAMNFYGSTETLSVAVDPVVFPENGGVIPVGKLLPEVSIRLISEDEQSAAVGETGEIYVKSPMLSAGYYRDAERTRSSYVADPLGQSEGIWFRTGDYGVMDENGVLSVVGRMDTMIKHHGYRMELGEVEAAVRQVSGCMEACCLLDRERDEIWCFASGQIEKTALMSELKKRLARYMLPDQCVILAAMPHNANMKIDRRALREMMGNR